MASEPLKGGRPAPTEAQPGTLPVKVIDNPPAATIEQALKQNQAQVDKSK